MTAHRLRTAAAKLREVPAPFRCGCEDDGETFTDHWFDRSICPEPCGSMHDICVECGYPKGGCMVATAERQPSPRDLATSDWLEAEAGRVERNNASDYDWTGHPALAVADAVLAEVAV